MPVFRSLSLEEFDKEFGSSYRSIFSGKEIRSRPFRSLEWQILLLPYGVNMEEQDFQILALAAEACGDREMVLVDTETIEPSEAAVVIPGSFFAFEKAKSRPETNLAIMDTDLFGRSGHWGCICAASLDDVAIVGGDSEFIACFVKAAGSTAALRDRFLEFSRTEWSVDDGTKSSLLRMVGW